MRLPYLYPAEQAIRRFDRAVRQAELDLIVSRQRLRYRRNQLGRTTWRRLQQPSTPLYGFLVGLTLGLLPNRGMTGWSRLLLPRLGSLGLRLYRDTMSEQ